MREQRAYRLDCVTHAAAIARVTASLHAVIVASVRACSGKVGGVNGWREQKV
jgi:hypothetical protein